MNTLGRLLKQVLFQLSRIGIDGFILALVFAIVLAWLFPTIGTGTGAFSLPSIAEYGVSIVFFLYGLKLDPAKLRSGLSNWKLPIIIHLATFVLFPLLVLPFRPVFTGEQTGYLWAGCFFLATLPSTVSSSVVMVSIAQGNIPAAIFNASISSILGVFITPLWMQLITGELQQSRPVTDTIVSLILQVLVPITLGLLLNQRGRGMVTKYGRYFKYLDQSVIVLIVFTSFCESFSQGMFARVSWAELFVLLMILTILFAIVYFLLSLITRWLGFNRADRITALFCGSKKSLVQGSVMVKVLFAGWPGAGLLLLPVMMYHALQLIIVSILAQGMGRKAAP